MCLEVMFWSHELFVLFLAISTVHSHDNLWLTLKQRDIIFNYFLSSLYILVLYILCACCVQIVPNDELQHCRKAPLWTATLILWSKKKKTAHIFIIFVRRPYLNLEIFLVVNYSIFNFIMYMEFYIYSLVNYSSHFSFLWILILKNVTF